MVEDASDRPLRQRKEWKKPVIRAIVAGSAEARDNQGIKDGGIGNRHSS